jgi:hypothetical protein
MQNKQRKQQAWSLRALTEHTLATPGSAWRLVRNAADARAQRKSSTAAAIKRTRAEDAEVPPPVAPADPVTGSKQTTPIPIPRSPLTKEG